MGGIFWFCRSEEAVSGIEERWIRVIKNVFLEKGILNLTKGLERNKHARIIFSNCDGLMDLNARDVATMSIPLIRPVPYRCKKCKKQTSITAGTFFHKTRTSLMTWFRMIFLVTNRERISTRRLQERLKIESYETALRNRKKIEKILDGILVSETAMDYKKLMGIVEIQDIMKWKIKKL